MNRSLSSRSLPASLSGLMEYLELFEQAWQEEKPPDLAEFLSTSARGVTEASTRRQLLEELVKIDLEYRWRPEGAEKVKASYVPNANMLPARPTLERYLALHPELTPSEQPSLNLIAEEYRVRWRWGDRPGNASYVKRFPAHSGELTKRLLQVDEELRREAGSANNTEQESERGATTVSGGKGHPAASSTGAVTVQGYEILAELGRGGMGVVYKARDQKLNRVVALKMIRAGDSADSIELARFRTEAEVIASLQHPNIVQIFEIGDQRGQPYFALEFCAAGSLASRLQGAPLPPKEAAQLTEVLARAVHAAHHRQIIHRDLKPANVLLQESPATFEMAHSAGQATKTHEQRMLGGAGSILNLTPKITDFGLARKLDSAASPTQTGAVMGTPSYMAPEQAAGKTNELGPAVDIYALGAILYELLTGRPPFRAATPWDTVMQVIKDEPVPPGRLQPKTPRDLETICLKCLHKDRARRYDSALSLAEDLKRFIGGEPIQARPVKALEKTWRWCRRKPAFASAIGLAVIALISTLVFLVVLLDQANRIAKSNAEDVRRETEAAARKRFLESEAIAPLEKEAERQRKELHDRLADPLMASVLLSDLEQWRALVLGADASLRQAETLVASNPGLVSPEVIERLRGLRARLEADERDRQFAFELDRIRLEALTPVEGEVDVFRALDGYSGLFREAGLDVMEGDLEEAATRIKASPIRLAVVAALDFWWADGTKDPGLQQRLLTIARQVDHDPWRNRFREVGLPQETLKELARSADLAKQSPHMLASLARSLKTNEERRTLLRSSLLVYPRDFWMHTQLGFPNEDAKEAIGAWRTALAVRPQSGFVYYNLGFALAAQKDLPGAIAAYRKAIEVDPKYAPAYRNLGNALGAQKDLPGAIAAYRKAIEVDPKHVFGYYNLGIALRAQKDLPGSIAAYRKAIEVDPKHVFSYINLGNALAAQKDLPGAIAASRKAIELDPMEARAQNGLGFTLRAQKDLLGAIAAFRKAIELDPNFAEAHCNLGHQLRDQGKFAEALESLKRGHELGSKQPTWTFPSGQWIKDVERSNALRDKKDLPGAIAAYRKAIELDPNDAEAHINLGIALRSQKDLPGALAAYRRSIELDPKDARGHVGLAYVLSAQKNVPGAIASFRNAIKVDPKNAEAHHSLGIFLLNQKDLPAAMIEFRNAIKADPNHAESYVRLGKALRDQHDLPGAMVQFRNAIKVDSKNAGAHYNLGIALQDQKDLTGAIAEFRKAIVGNPKFAHPRLLLANALAVQGDVANSIVEYRKAINLYPDDAEAQCTLGKQLRDLGKFAEALEAFKRGHELGSKLSNWKYPSAQWVKNCERLIELDEKLPHVLAGKVKPANSAERLELAFLCQRYRERHLAAVSFYTDAFADPKLSENPLVPHRHNAACAAIAAAAGQGKDAGDLIAKERTALRHQALDWLRADLAGWNLLLKEKAADGRTATLARELQHRLADKDLAGVRDEVALAKLPAAEQEAWRSFWVSLREVSLRLVDLDIDKAIPNPVLNLTKKTKKEATTLYHFSIVNRDQFPDFLFVLAPDLPPIVGEPSKPGLDKDASRTVVRIYDSKGNVILVWVGLKSSAALDMLLFNSNEEKKLEQVYVEIHDRRLDRKWKSNLVDLKRDQ